MKNRKYFTGLVILGLLVFFCAESTVAQPNVKPLEPVLPGQPLKRRPGPQDLRRLPDLAISDIRWIAHSGELWMRAVIVNTTTGKIDVNDANHFTLQLCARCGNDSPWSWCSPVVLGQHAIEHLNRSHTHWFQWYGFGFCDEGQLKKVRIWIDFGHVVQEANELNNIYLFDALTGSWRQCETFDSCN